MSLESKYYDYLTEQNKKEEEATTENLEKKEQALKDQLLLYTKSK